jgi:hypothetical protein
METQVPTLVSAKIERGRNECPLQPSGEYKIAGLIIHAGGLCDNLLATS